MLRRVEHFDARRRQQLRQALAAELHRMLHTLPAGFGEGLEGILETFGSRHLAIVPEARLFIARRCSAAPPRWRQNFAFSSSTASAVSGGCIFIATGQRIDAGQVRPVRSSRTTCLSAGALIWHLDLSKKKRHGNGRVGWAQGSACPPYRCLLQMAVRLSPVACNQLQARCRTDRPRCRSRQRRRSALPDLC